MSGGIEYRMNHASVDAIHAHLSRCDADFVPRLSTRVELNGYAKKIAASATRFEAWSGDELVGLAAVYCNDLEQRIGYITSVSVLAASAGKGIATRLTSQCVEHARRSGMRQVSLEVASDNLPALKLYEKLGFRSGGLVTSTISMYLNLSIAE